MNDKEYLDVCAMLAMQVLLKEDLKRGVDNQMGRDWIAKQSYKVAESMVSERNSRDIN